MDEAVRTEIRAADKAVGLKQVLRGLKEGTLRRVILAEDADTFYYTRVREAAEAARVPITRVPSMAELGQACGVSGDTAAGGLRK